MKIDLATLKRVANRTPELTIAQFVAVWVEKIEDQERERDRERHRKQPENERKDDGKPPTYEEQEKALYAFAKTVCGNRAGGLVTDLLKQHGRDIAAVHTIFERAQRASDPKAFVAGTIRKQGNGARPSTMATLDDVVERERLRAIGGDGPLLDLTPERS
jgi:hypothetical protein